MEREVERRDCVNIIHVRKDPGHQEFAHVVGIVQEWISRDSFGQVNFMPICGGVWQAYPWCLQDVGLVFTPPDGPPRCTGHQDLKSLWPNHTGVPGSPRVSPPRWGETKTGQGCCRGRATALPLSEAMFLSGHAWAMRLLRSIFKAWSTTRCVSLSGHLVVLSRRVIRRPQSTPRRYPSHRWCHSPFHPPARLGNPPETNSFSSDALKVGLMWYCPFSKRVTMLKCVWWPLDACLLTGHAVPLATRPGQLRVLQPSPLSSKKVSQAVKSQLWCITCRKTTHEWAASS